MRILFITNASHTPSQSDYNHFQRVDYLSRHADLTLWGRKDADFAASAKPGTPVVRAAMGGKLGLVLQVFLFALIGRAATIRRRVDRAVPAEPDGADLQDLRRAEMGRRCLGRSRPDRRPARPIDPCVAALNRYILKRAFTFADFFLLSIRPDYEFEYFAIPPDRMLVMKNAIRVKEFQPSPARSAHAEGFEILCTRSSYHSDMGLDTMAQAFQRLRQAGHDVTLTIVGRIPASCGRRWRSWRAIPRSPTTTSS